MDTPNRFHDITMKDFSPPSKFERRTSKSFTAQRHTFINKLYSEKVDENVIKALVGHEKEFTMKHYGGDPFSPERFWLIFFKVNSAHEIFFTIIGNSERKLTPPEW